MTDLGVLQEGRARRGTREARRRQARRRRLVRGLAVALVLAIGALTALLAGGSATVTRDARPSPPGGAATAAVRRPPHHAGYALTPAPVGQRVNVTINKGLRSGLLFDVRTGRVLWARDPNRRLPIASLTKMMTALVVVERSHPSDRVLITRQAIDFSGSGVGLLPLHKHVDEKALLYGLLLPSGNDAAIALAQHVAGTQQRFVALMNRRAAQMSLRCTHFSNVSGIVDQGNYSCAGDLALLAHAVLEQPLLGRIVASRSAVLPFPIKGGKLFLYNNNPLLLMRYPGTDGVKTGYTVAAGDCLVAAARRHGRWFGVVLLHSINTWGQAERLLNAAFARRGA
jgi:D-alanyl-D-alanine carboxypeptidase